MANHHWLVKQEPTDFPWTAFARDGGAAWTGVRNFQARNHLRAMQVGDVVFYYHSGEQRQVVGLATVTRAAYPDPTATDGDWSCVDLKPLHLLPEPIPLARIKADPKLKELGLVKQSRLSVMPVGLGEFRRLLELGGQRRPERG